MNKTNSKKIILRGIKNGDEHQISKLLFNNFPDPLKVELIEKTWKWQFKNFFSKNSAVAIAEYYNEIIAHYAVMLLPMNYLGRKITGSISTATVTDKKARGKGLFIKLATKVYKEIKSDGCKLVFGFPNSQSIKGFTSRLEWFEINKFPLYIKPIKFTPFLNKIIKIPLLSKAISFFIDKIFKLAVQFLTMCNEEKSFKIIDSKDNITDEFSNIWKSFFASKKIAVIRNTEYLKWRYLEKPFYNYDIFAAVDKNGHIVGYLIISFFAKKGFNIVYIMELTAVNDNNNIYKNLLKHAEKYAYTNGADAISMLCLPNNPNKKLFLKFGFINIPKKMFPQDIHFCGKILSDDISKPYVKNPDNWYISWGDLDVV